MNVHFAAEAWEDFLAWLGEDRAMAQKILELIQEVHRTPFTGRGKPEPLKGSFANHWSRRIDRKHRLVYRIEGQRGTDQRVVIVACRDHYGD